MIGPHTGVWVICAAYNEVATIARVVTELKVGGYQVVVVDDGSTDGTRHVAAAAGAVVVTHPINLGQGAALQTGIEYALSQAPDLQGPGAQDLGAQDLGAQDLGAQDLGAQDLGAQDLGAIVTFDADGQHRVSDIPRLIEALERERADFALGSRFLGHTYDLPALRRAVLQAATLFTRVTTGLRLTDTHNGLRAMTRRGAATLRLRQNRMAHASEILAEIAKSGLRYVEVPVTIDYTAYSLAKGQRLGDSVMILLDLFSQELCR